jgi:hypothetical protein
MRNISSSIKLNNNIADSILTGFSIKRKASPAAFSLCNLWDKDRKYYCKWCTAVLWISIFELPKQKHVGYTFYQYNGFGGNSAFLW